MGEKKLLYVWACGEMREHVCQYCFDSAILDAADAIREETPMTKHKPDCQIYKAGGPGPNFYCDCQVDKPTLPAPTEAEVRESPRLTEEQVKVLRNCDWIFNMNRNGSIQTRLRAAFPEAFEQGGGE